MEYFLNILTPDHSEKLRYILQLEITIQKIVLHPEIFEILFVPALS